MLREAYLGDGFKVQRAQVHLFHLPLHDLNAWKISEIFIQQTEIFAVMFVNAQDEQLCLKILEREKKEMFDGVFCEGVSMVMCFSNTYLSKKKVLWRLFLKLNSTS